MLNDVNMILFHEHFFSHHMADHFTISGPILDVLTLNAIFSCFVKNHV